MLKFRTALMYLAAVFLPLFFVPLPGGGETFSLELNFVATIMLCMLAATYLPRILANPWTLYGVLGPWLVILLLYMLTHTFIGPRSSLTALIPQIVFMISSLGLGFCLWDCLKDGSGHKRITIFCTIVIISFFTVFVFRAPTSYLVGLFDGVTRLSPPQIIFYTRRAFDPGNYITGEADVFLIGQHNRIAQHVFSHGFLVQTLILFVYQLGLKPTLLSRAVWAASLALMVFSVLLLSGQSLASAVIATIICLIGIQIYRFSYGLAIALFLSGIPFLVIFAAISQTEFFQIWYERFSGGNFDTGRFDRWAYYFGRTQDFTIMGLSISDTLDPHNFFVTLLFEAGVLAWAMGCVFCIAILLPAIIDLKKGTQEFGTSFLMMISVGPQIAFAVLISGGWGFPGWAEWSKLPLLVLSVLLASRLRKSDERGMPNTIIPHPATTPSM